jgi:hypothetical protein
VVPHAEVVVTPPPIKGDKHDDHLLFEEDKHDTSDSRESFFEKYKDQYDEETIKKFGIFLTINKTGCVKTRLRDILPMSRK